MKTPFILLVTAIASGLVGAGIHSLLTGKPADVANAGIVIATERLKEGTPRQWKPGEPRYIVVSKPGEDVKSLLTKAVAEPDYSRQNALIARIAETLLPEEFPEAFEILHRSAAPSKAATVGTLLYWWASRDPKAACAKISTLPDFERHSFQRAVLSGWSSTNDTEAFAFVESLPDNARKKELLQSLILQLGAYNPVKPLEQLRAHPELDESLVSTWAKGDPEAAFNWVKQLPDRDQRTRALGSALHNLGFRDPEKALDLFFKELPDHPQLINHGSFLFGLLARKDTAKALQAVDRLPEGESKYHARFSVLAEWVNQDPEKALAYALSLPSSNAHNPVPSVLSIWIQRNPRKGLEWIEKNLDSLSPNSLHSVITSLSFTQPEKALGLAALLPTGLTQLNAIFSPAERLTRKDRAAAEAYLENLPEGPVREKFVEGYLSGIADQNPLEAVQMAQKLPPENTRTTSSTG